MYQYLVVLSVLALHDTRDPGARRNLHASLASTGLRARRWCALGDENIMLQGRHPFLLGNEADGVQHRLFNPSRS